MIALNFNGTLQFAPKSETFGSHQIHDIFCTLLFSAHLYENDKNLSILVRFLSVFSVSNLQFFNIVLAYFPCSHGLAKRHLMRVSIKT